MNAQSVLFLSTAIITAVVCPALAQDVKGVRKLAIPHREHGYGNFRTQVIDTQAQFDVFLKKLDGSLGWNNRAGFVEGLTKAKIDFTKEALVLVRQTEGSGSNVVTFSVSEPKDGKVVCAIQRKVAEIGTADIADYCLAITVSKNQVNAVEVTENGKRRELLKIRGERN